MFGFELETLKMKNQRRLWPLAFQANDAGSIPATRSILYLEMHNWVEYAIKKSRTIKFFFWNKK